MLLVVALMVPMLPSFAFAASKEDFAWSVMDDGTVCIDSFTGKEGRGDTHVVIPGEIDGLPVTKLAQEAFAYNGFVDTIVIPESVTFIGNSAFYHCSDLDAIVFRGQAPELEFTVAEGSSLKKLFVLENCQIGTFCARLVNDLGAERAAQVEVLTFGDLDALDAAYNAYVAELAAPVETTQPVQPEIISVDIPVEINPLYEGVVSNVEQAESAPVMMLSDPEYGTVEEAIVALRAGMKNRLGTITVYVKTNAADHSAIFYEMFERAFDHTGVPTEGDYLAFHYASRGGGINGTADGQGNKYLAYRYDMTYYDTAEQQVEMDAAVASLLARLNLSGKSDYEKICAIYDWMCENITYDYDHLEAGNYPLMYSAYAALLNKTAVCQGYANLFYRLALEAGVDNRIISGIGNGGPHAWNIVELDGLYYDVDATWDAIYLQAGVPYAFFLKCEETFEDHSRDPEYDTDRFHAAYPMAEQDYSAADNSQWGGLSWTLEDGVLIISGEGTMPENAAGMPWAQAGYADEIEKVLILEGVTSIAAGAFANHKNLTRVILPDSMHIIGDGAFANCPELYSLTLPAGVNKIGSGILSGSNVWIINFWGDAPVMDDNAFSGTQMMALYPEKDSWTPDMIQDYGGITEWYCEPAPLATGMYGFIRWAVYGYGMTMEGFGPMASQTSAAGYPWAAYADSCSVVEMTGITSIGDYAFENFTINELYFPESLQAIGAGAFRGCGDLSWITFTSEAPDIAADAFEGVTAEAHYSGAYKSWVEKNKCQNYGGNLTWIEASYPVDGGEYCGYYWEVYSDGYMYLNAMGDVGLMDSQTSAGDYPWAAYSSLVQSMYLSDLQNIPAYAFENFTALTDVTLYYRPNAVESRAFAGCAALKTFEIRYSDWFPIAEDAFTGVTATMIYGVHNEWPDSARGNYGGNLTWKALPGMPITAEGQFGGLEWSLGQNGSVLCISGNGPMPNGTAPQDYPWYPYLPSIRTVYLVGVSTVGDYAFSGAPMLMTVNLSANLTQIGTGAFSNCSQLQNVEFRSAPPVIAEDAFAGVTNAWMMYPYSLKDLWTEEHMLHYGGNLSWSMMVEGLEYGTLDSGVQWQILENGEMHFYESGPIETMATYPWSKYASLVTSVSLGDVTSIGDGAFADMTALEYVTIPNTVTAIGANAFRNCTGLNDIIFDGGAPAIAETAFTGVSASVYYPGTDTLWPESARVNYGGELNWVPTAFELAGGYWCDMYWSLNNEGTLVFNYWGTMDNLASPSEYPWYPFRDFIRSIACHSPENIGTNAFQGCANLVEVTIGGNCRTIGSNAFADCTSLQNISFSGAAAQIGENAFQNVTAMVWYYDNGTWTEENMLNYGGNLSWRIPGQDNWIVAEGQYGENIFWELDSNGRMTLSGSGPMESQTQPGDYPWYAYGPQIFNLEVYDITSIGDYAFAGLPVLNQVTVYSTLTTIGSNAFVGCTNLTELHFRGDAPVIGDNAFGNVIANLYYPSGNETWDALSGNQYGGNLSWYNTTFWIDGGEIGTMSWNLYTGGNLYFWGEGEMPNLDSAESYPWYPYRDQIFHISMDDGILNVGDYAFAGMENLRDISLGQGLTAIGIDAFEDCTSLTSIYFYGSAPTIADNAFGNVTAFVSCPDSWSADVRRNYGGDLTWSGYSYSVAYGYYGDVYWELYSDGNLNISGDHNAMESQPSAEGYPWYPYRDQVICLRLYDLPSLGDYAFDGYSALEEVHLDDEVYGIGAGAFRNCTALYYIWIGKAEPFTLAADAFAGVTSVIFYPNNHPCWQQEDLTGFAGDLTWNPYAYTVDYGSFNGIEWNLNGEGTLYLYGGNTDGVMTDQADASGYPWYAYRDRIFQVEMSEITTVGDHAFRDCTNLHTVYVGNQTNRIGAYAFASIGLEAVYFMGDAPEIADTAFTDVTACAYYPRGFMGWDTAVNQNYGGNLEWDTHSVCVADGTTDAGLSWTVYSGGNLNLYSSDSYIEDFSPDNPAPWVEYASWITSAHVNQTNFVGDYTFAGLYNLENVHFNSYIATIGDGVFQNCTALEEVWIPDSVSSLGSDLFSGCSETLVVRFQGGAPTFDPATFAGASLTVEYDGNYDSWNGVAGQPFGGNVNWVNVTDSNIAKGTCGTLEWALDQNYVLTLSGTGAMDSYGSTSVVPWAAYAADIQEVYLPEGLTAIGSYCFYGLTSLTELRLPSTLEDISVNAIGNCPNLNQLYFEGSAPSMADGAISLNAPNVEVPGYNDSWLSADVLKHLGDGAKLTDTEGSIFGICGANVVWKMDVLNSTLRIAGTGDMYDYYMWEQPWMPYANQITTAVVEEGVTGLGDCTFCDIGVQYVTLPSTLRTIGSNAFAGCVRLTELVIPEGVTTIGASAFMASDIARLSLPATLTEMEPTSAMYGMWELVELTVAEDNKVFRAVDNVLFSRDMTRLLYYPRNFTGTYQVPEGVTTLAKASFENTYVYEVILPRTVTTIEEEAFIRSDVAYVTMPDSVTQIHANAFRYCNGVTFYGHAGSAAESFAASHAFDFEIADHTYGDDNLCIYCGKTEAITGTCGEDLVWTLDETTGLLTITGTGAMEDYTARTPAPWQEYAASVESVVLDDRITHIGSYAFYGLTWLEECPELPESLESIGNDAFYKLSFRGDLVIPDKVTEIGSYAFASCSFLTSVTFGSSVENIGAYAFQNAIRLAGDLVLPDSVTYIGEYAFAGCRNLNGTLTLSENLRYIPLHVFEGCGFTGDLVIPDSVTDIEESAFYNCQSLNGTLTLSENLVYIGRYAFANCGFTGSLVIPDSVQIISSDAFNANTGLTEVIFGSGLHVLGTSYAWTGEVSAFNGCTGVKHVRFTSVNAPTCYGNLFAAMADLETVYVPGDNFASYQSILSLLPQGVKLLTEGEKIAVDGLQADAVYSKTAVLSWQSHLCAEDVESYSIFRDGVEIGTSESCTFTDRTLEPGKTYVYTVCANFGDKQSVASDVLNVTPVLPVVQDVTTEVTLNGISRLTTGYNHLTILVPAGENLRPLGKQVTSVALYYGDGNTRNFLGYATREEKLDSAGWASYTFNWDVALLADGDYVLTAVITDVDGTSATYSETMTVDNTEPSQLELVAISSEQYISISWSFAPEVDAVGYRLYRKTGETGSFQLLGSCDNRYVQAYADWDVTENEIYYYFVTSVDAFGRESEPSAQVGATLMLDAVSPKVTKLTPGAGNYLTGTVSFTVKAEDNVSVTNIWLSYSLDEGASWVDFGEGQKANLDTNLLPDGPIWIKAVAGDAKGNLSDDFIQKYRVDNTGPEQVTGLDFVATSVTLTLSWNNVADEDIGWFLVEKKLDNGTYQTVNSRVTALGINLQGLTPATAYTYRVTAYDQFGNAGIPSEELVAKTTADAVGPVITQILPAAGRYSEMIPVSATVKDEYCVSSVTLQYSVDNINWKDIVTQTYTDIQAVRTLHGELSLENVDEGYVYIRAIALDNEGNASKNESFVQHRVDKTAPAAPIYVTATGGDGYIEISWQSSASDVTQFALYRSESPDGEFLLLRELSTLNCFDRDVEDEKTYYYQVAAKDSAGNWSQRSLVVSAASLADGEIPQIYSIYPANNSILGLNNATISVLAADNGGLQSILVEYSHDGEDYQTLAQLHNIGQYSAIAAGTLPMAEFANGDTAYIRATATDGYGNVCHSDVNTYTIDTQAPAVLAVSAEHVAGRVSLKWTGGMEADLAGYRIYRKVPGGSYSLVNQVYGIAGQSEYSYIDGTVSGGTYIYLITAVDNVNNSAGLESGQVVVPVSSKPKAVLNCDAVMVAKAQYVIDASESYDNSAIVSYQIDFGDGTEESTSSKAIHAYNEVGTYIITLTVTDDEGNTNITTKRITVKSGDLAGTARIRIVDENGAPVPNAPVYFDLGEETQVIRVTDSSGYVTFTAEVGTHTVGCVIANNEWLPVKKDIIVTAGEETSVSMTLVNKPIVEGSFEIKRMTLEEIKAAGIDITAPENQYYVEVHLNLRYDNMDLQTSIIAGPGGTSGEPIIIPVGGGGNIDDDDDGKGPGTDWRVVFPTVLRPYSASEEVAVALLDIPVGVSTLKEFFDVKLHVINNASSEFSMLDNVITLNVPEGLTLMDTYNTDPQTVRIAEIKGQTSETLEWILRGDAIGEYYLDADYSGILSQFNEPISTKFKATEPIEVYGMSNLKLVVDVAQELDRGTLYYNVSLINEGEIDVYRPNITTPDVLIEMELFDRTNAEKAAYYDFDVMSIEKENLSVNLNTLPDVLNPGDRLTMHYMNVDDTTYTECRMALTSMMAEYENTYGLKVEMKERPISFFLANLSTSVNAYEKASETFDYNGSKGAYDYIMTDSNFVYWCMANNKEGLEISGDGAETLFEVISGDWSDALGKDDQEQARAMVLRVLELASTENAFAAYANVLNWIALFQSVINGKIPGKQITVKDAEYLGLALEDIQNNRKWELYVAINGISYQASDKVIVEAWAETITDALGIAPASEELLNRLHKVYSDKAFQYVWEEFGIKNDYLDVLTEAASDVASDISVYIAAQSDINTYTFYLNQLIQYLGQDDDSRFLRIAAKDILEVITEGDLIASVIENTIEDGAWKLVDTGIDALIKKVPVVNKVMVVLKISADVMDLLFNINERHDVANNIRFVDALSDAAKASTKYWRSQYMAAGTNYASEHYMMMISLMLDIRAAGESQATQYGVTYETGMVPVGSGALFRAAADYVNAPLDIETWYQWRDYVEDKISRCRIQLLKNPVSTDVNEKTAPVVTFDYASGQTAQRFGEAYVYSLNGGRSWTACDGSAIAVSPSMNATELRVRRKDATGNSESLTAVVPIYGPADLDHSGIVVKETATGYRVENLDNDERYQVTVSETPVKYPYGESLERDVPAGSYSYEIQTNVDYEYVYVRMLESSEHYASYTSLVEVQPMQDLTVIINGTGYVVAQERYEYGEMATIVAAPLEGWLFQGWYMEDQRVSTELAYTLEMTEGRTITAKFLEIAQQQDGAKLDPETMQAIGFGESTSAEDVMSYYEALDLAAKVINSAGDAFTGNFVGTGCLVSVGGWEFTVVISGDVDGNGEVDVYDLRKMLDCMNEEITLEGAYYEAACFTGEDELSIFDIRAALDYMNGKTETP